LLGFILPFAYHRHINYHPQRLLAPHEVSLWSVEVWEAWQLLLELLLPLQTR
jgi:hypothetical protein